MLQCILPETHFSSTAGHGSVVTEWRCIVCINYSSENFKGTVLGDQKIIQMHVPHVINICPIIPIQVLNLHGFHRFWCWLSINIADMIKNVVCWYLNPLLMTVNHSVETPSMADPQWNMFPDSKVHGANMGPTWVLSSPGGPHVGPMNLAIWVVLKVQVKFPHSLLRCDWLWVGDRLCLLWDYLVLLYP